MNRIGDFITPFVDEQQRHSPLSCSASGFGDDTRGGVQDIRSAQREDAFTQKSPSMDHGLRTAHANLKAVASDMNSAFWQQILEE
ncbi:hypothetical protein DM860_016576 [Cuscuta australis]|uniref:Uncharacterized protein n=1 Tax=Cuscuta australis TaxID=267555 RepID=A0A328DMR0_9ASTE|nr:hypothetical protein DM860_016576 [Cuscuta australis]